MQCDIEMKVARLFDEAKKRLAVFFTTVKPFYPFEVEEEREM